MAKKKTKRVYNCLPSPNQEKDWNISEAKDSGLLAAAAPIPASKDLRESSWWKINDQGFTGSCVGWATADSVVRWHMVKAGKITKSKLLSPRFVWMASKETDEFNDRPSSFIEIAGTSLKAALDIARNFGNIEDSILPFASGQLYQGKEKTLYAIASQLKTANYISLGTNLMEWKRWIALNGPILTRLDVDPTWENVGSDGNLDVYQPSPIPAGHAVAIVGYTAERFIIRNSWGVGWGDKGFGYASIAYAQAAFTEAYGVSV